MNLLEHVLRRNSMADLRLVCFVEPHRDPEEDVTKSRKYLRQTDQRSPVLLYTPCGYGKLEYSRVTVLFLCYGTVHEGLRYSSVSIRKRHRRRHYRETEATREAEGTYRNVDSIAPLALSLYAIYQDDGL